MTIKKTILTIILFACLNSMCLSAEIVNVSVAASMTDAFKKLAVSFAKKHPDITLRYNFGSSGSLAKQISQGAPADIYVSANTKWMDHLIATHHIDAASTRTFAHNRLVFIGKKGRTLQSLTELTGFHRIALGSPKSVPAGQYAEEAMRSAGVYDSLVSRNKFIFTKDVRQALLYADRGEADGAFVYQTDALLAEKAVVLYKIPGTLYARIIYPLALTRSGMKNDKAKIVYTYLSGEDARAILASFGFEPPTH